MEEKKEEDEKKEEKPVIVMPLEVWEMILENCHKKKRKRRPDYYLVTMKDRRPGNKVEVEKYAGCAWDLEKIKREVKQWYTWHVDFETIEEVYVKKKRVCVWKKETQV
jgi:hypothetical protein